MQMLPPQMFVNRSWCALGLLGLLSLGASACGMASEDEPEDAGQVIILEEHDDDENDENKRPDEHDSNEQPTPQEQPEPPPEPEPEPDPQEQDPVEQNPAAQCDAGQKWASLEGGAMMCHDLCQPGSSCGSGRQCVSFLGGQGAEEFFCVDLPPEPELVSRDRMLEHVNEYAATVTPAGAVYVIYESDLTGNLMATIGEPGALPEPVVLREGEGPDDPSNLLITFTELRATTSPDGKILASYQEARGEISSSSPTLTFMRSYLLYGADIESGTISAYPSSGYADWDFDANYDVAFDPTGGIVSAYSHTHSRTIRFRQLDSQADAVELFAPTARSSVYHLRMDAQGGGHLVYLDPEVNGAVYQYVSPQGEGTIDMSAKLEGLEDQPASVSMDIAPDGTLGIHLTRWEDGQTTFILGAPVVRGSSVESFNFAYDDVPGNFGAFPETQDIAYSPTMGFVMCGQRSDERIWCQTVSSAPRPLPLTQISQGPVSSPGAVEVNSLALQLDVAPDGTLHVFWTQENQNRQQHLHHAVVR